MTGAGPRTHIARALRDLCASWLERDLDATSTVAFARKLDELHGMLASTPRRERFSPSVEEIFLAPRPDGASLDDVPDSIVSGSENPLGLGLEIRRDGEAAVARMRLGPTYMGPPGRVHGGVLAAILDDLTRANLLVLGVPAFTARLEVNFRAAAPIGALLVFRSQLERRDRRKIHVALEVRDDGGLVADGNALLVTI